LLQADTFAYKETGMHHTTPLITTIVGALVLAFLLGMLANRLRISPLVVT